MVRRTCFLLIAALWAGGCAHLPGSFPERALLGAWRFEDGAMGPLEISFKEDYTFGVDYDADGQPDITGAYYFFLGKIKFTDNDARVKTDCYEPGFYGFSVQGDRLVFDRYADQCPPRIIVLSRPFVRMTGEK